MKKRIHFLFLFLSLLFFTSAQAASLTGKELLADCQVALDIYDKSSWRVQIDNDYTQGVKTGICKGYLASVNDVYASTSSKRSFCPPDNNWLEQITAVVKYLKDHPAEQNIPASVIVVRANQKYFRCA